MAGSGWTNRGKQRVMAIALAGETPPTNFYWALVTSASAPGPDTNTKSELTEVANGNGYTTGGIVKARNATNFPFVEDDTNDWTLADPPDLAWTASGGSIPASGSPPHYLILTDDNATQGSREVWFYHDLASDPTVPVGQVFTIANPLIKAA